jgi:hypothetical protein
MSTKTLRKRIALVAVSALGAGLLSVVAVPSANAAAGNATAVRANVNTGVATATGGSVGLLSEDGEGTTQTAVLLATGAIATTYTGVTVTATVTGGRFTEANNATISGTSSASATASSNSSTAVSLLAVPNAGATSMVISYLANAVTVERISVTIVATSAYNVFSPTYSTVYWGDGTDYTSTTDATSSNSNKASDGTVSGKITLADAYGNALTSANTSLVTVTATGGALVKLTSLTTAGDRETDYTTLTGSAISFNVQQSDADVPLNSTVTVAIAGTVVATKSLVIAGEVAKVTAQLPKIGKIGGANTDAALITYADSAGNRVYPASGTSLVSATAGSIVTAASVSRYATSLTDAASGFTTLAVTCALSGTQKGLQVQHLNSSGTVVKSNAWDAGCADVPYSMTASFDKASYKRGEVATLTLAVKDSKGNAGNAYDTIVATSADNLTITGGPGTIVTAVAVDNKLSYSTGAKTYQFTVTLDDGDYNAVIVPTTIKGNNALQSNLAVPFSVTSTAGVTNADVLKAIVSLIASINKQIAALQKALLKR